MNSELMKDAKYMSTVTCGCGCQNFMPQHAVDRGRIFLYGHKPRGGHIPVKRSTQTKTFHLHSSGTSPDGMKLFAEEQVKTLETQLKTLESKLSELDKQKTLLVESQLEVEVMLEKWIKAKEALSVL